MTHTLPNEFSTTDWFVRQNMPGQIDEWQERLGRDLNKFEQLVVARPFRWNETNKSWYRLIKPVWDGEPQGYIEIQISPNRDTTWEQLKSIKVSLTRLAIDKDEVLRSSSQLGNQLKVDLVNNLGQETASILLYSNLFPLIDMDIYKGYIYSPNYDNKSVPFAAITNVPSDEKVT